VFQKNVVGKKIAFSRKLKKGVDENDRSY